MAEKKFYPQNPTINEKGLNAFREMFSKNNGVFGGKRMDLVDNENLKAYVSGLLDRRVPPPAGGKNEYFPKGKLDESLVKQAQSNMGLPQTGVIDGLTYEKMTRPPLGKNYDRAFKKIIESDAGGMLAGVSTAHIELKSALQELRTKLSENVVYDKQGREVSTKDLREIAKGFSDHTGLTDGDIRTGQKLLAKLGHDIKEGPAGQARADFTFANALAHTLAYARDPYGQPDKKLGIKTAHETKGAAKDFTPVG